MTDPRWPVVLFDLDGTIADTIGLILASYDHALVTVLRESRPQDELRRMIGRPLTEAFEEAWPGRGEELASVYRPWNLAHTLNLIRPYAGMNTMLDQLRAQGVRTGVVTSKSRPAAQACMDALALTSRVALLTTLDDTARHKPHPAPLQHALVALGAEPIEAVYVGDATVDVQAARAAGMAAVAVSWGAGDRSELDAQRPDHVMATVADLTALLLPPE